MLAHFLGGLAEGAAGEFSKQSEEKRKNKAAQDKLVSDSILDRMKNDDTLTPDQHLQLQEHFYKLNGVDNKTAQGLMQASTAFRQSHEEHTRKTQTDQSQAAMGPIIQGGAAPLEDAQAPSGGGLGDLPTMKGSGADATKMAPEMPNFKGKTVGELNLPQQIHKAASIASATSQAQREAQANMLEDEMNFKTKKTDETNARVKSGEITQDQANQYLEIYGIKPGAQGGKGTATFVPAVMSGADLQARMKQEGKPQSEIDAVDPKGYFRVALDPSKTHTVSWFATQPNTYQGKASLGSLWKDKFPTDISGNPIELDQVYVPVLARSGGQPIGVMPETLINSVTTKKGYKTIQQPDGSTVLIPVTETSETDKIPQGAGASAPAPVTGGASVAPPVPTMPDATTPAPAATSSKKPITMRTPIPTSPSVGRGGVVVGGKAMSPNEKVTNEQRGNLYNTSIGVVKSLKRDLPVLSSMLSSGKIAMQVNPQQGMWSAIINRNMSMTPAEERIAAHWQQLADEIMELRIPLGAAAGRNADMMNIIEANKGILTQKPEIIGRMLDNALSEFQNLRNPIGEASGKYKFKFEPELGQARDEGASKTFAHYAVGAGGHRIGTDDGKKWFDTVTGAEVK